MVLLCRKCPSHNLRHFTTTSQPSTFFSYNLNKDASYPRGVIIQEPQRTWKFERLHINLLKKLAAHASIDAREKEQGTKKE